MPASNQTMQNNRKVDLKQVTNLMTEIGRAADMNTAEIQTKLH